MSSKQITLTLLIILISVVAFGQLTIDPSKSKVNFEVGNMWLGTAKGTLTGLTGTVDEERGIIAVQIPAASIFTDNAKRDEHLKTDDFFDVTLFPQINFKAFNVNLKQANGKVSGTLTIKNKSQEVEIPFERKLEGGTRVYTGTLTVSRRYFDLGADYGTFMIDDEVKVQILVYTSTQ